MPEPYSFPDIRFMDLSYLPASFVERKLKAIATRYARTHNLHFSEGLQEVAKHYGFNTWNDLHNSLRKHEYEEAAAC